MKAQIKKHNRQIERKTMSSQLSTPINNLPATDVSSVPPIVNDPVVTDVLAEMEKEVAMASHNSPPQQNHVQIQPQHTVQKNHPSMHATIPQHVGFSSNYQGIGNQIQMPILMPPYMKNTNNQWIDPSKLQLAVIATVVALVLLVPNTAFIYEKFQRLMMLKSYDIIIRAIMLTLVLYITMVRLG